MNAEKNFVHLHVHSHFSLLDGLSKIDELVARAKELNMSAMALTDHGALYGAVYFVQECEKAGIKPIIGCEVYVCEDMRSRQPSGAKRDYFHLVLLAKNNTGYQNLIKLVTASHLEGFYYKPRVDKNLLRKHSEGLICLSGCLGSELSRAIHANQHDKAKKIALEHAGIFEPGDYFIEIQQHINTPDQNIVTPKLVKLAKELNLPLVATQDSHYLKKEDAHAHDILLAVQTGNKLDDEDRLTLRHDDFSLSTPKEMMEKFNEWPEAIKNTQKIADKCQTYLTLGKFIFPDFPLEPGKTADQMLDELTLNGMRQRDLINDPETEKRRLYELQIIKNKNYAPYFLVVADILDFAHKSQIYTTVRGSVAGSLVAYLAGITNINPLEFQLPFERFLNPFRPSAPDIDMDFADNRRQEVIEYAKQKYGNDKVAQIGTFGTMMAKGAVRDVARALGKPYGVGDKIAKLIPFGAQGFPMTIKHALELEPELKDLYENDPEAQEILNLAEKLEGTVRHVSVHAAGVVIAPKPLIEYTPIQFDPKESGNLITQYDMYTVGEDGIGLTKLDFLGIRNLAILENAVSLVLKNRNINIDIEKIPFDDEQTFKMLANGETEGLFQLNGSGMTKYLKDLQPTSIHDINAMIALYRPGPIKNIPEYIARKQGRCPITYFNPKAEKFLAKSYGILVYQDDLLFTAMELAGYNWESVDKLRKAVGKKNPAEMAKQHETFVKGCQTHSGINKEEAEKIWDLFEPFQGYGFNKAHAASYGRVAYQTAYMKAHFPTDYMCAILIAEAGDTEKTAQIIAECQRMNIEVLPPDINESLENFSIPSLKEEKIRFGLAAIKNVGSNTVAKIVRERLDQGPYLSVEDFILRVAGPELNKKSLESLIMAGAFDSLGERRQLLSAIEILLSFAREANKANQSNQVSLFESSNILPKLSLPDAPPATRDEKLKWEKELLGFWISDHPLTQYEKIINNIAKPIKTIREMRSGSIIKTGGVITKIKKILTKQGEPMLFINIEDLTDRLEVVVFPRVLSFSPSTFRENAVVLIEGTLDDRDGEPKILARSAEELVASEV